MLYAIVGVICFVLGWFACYLVTRRNPKVADVNAELVDAVQSATKKGK